MNSFDLLWCGEYSQDWENALHEHNFYQMILVTGGSALADLNGKEFRLEAGMLALIQPRCPHGIHSGNAFHVYDAKFDAHDPQLVQQLKTLPQIMEPEDFQMIKTYFQWMMREGEAKQPFYPQTISCYFWMILVRLLRPGTILSETALAARPENPLICKGIDVGKLEHYIRENYVQPLTLDDLTAVANCNKTTLIQAFKEVYGITPFGYIIQIRLQKARELLVNTDISVSEISDLVGFASVHYFSRFFKEKEHYSPLEFRAKYSKNHFLTF